MAYLVAVLVVVILILVVLLMASKAKERQLEEKAQLEFRAWWNTMCMLRAWQITTASKFGDDGYSEVRNELRKSYEAPEVPSYKR